MKIKKGFLLCPYMDKTIAIPGADIEKEFSGMIKMNEPSVDIWKWIEAGEEIENIYSLYGSTYGVDLTVSKRDVDSVIAGMREAGIIEE